MKMALQNGNDLKNYLDSLGFNLVIANPESLRYCLKNLSKYIIYTNKL